MIDEMDRRILSLLQQDARLPNAEIARRVGGRKRMQQDPDWIRPVLRRMVAEELIEADEFGQLRLKLRDHSKPVPQKLTMDNWETWQLVLEEDQDPEVIGPAPC